MSDIYEFFKSIALFTNSTWKYWQLITKLGACVALVHHFHHQIFIHVNKSSYYFGTSKRSVRNKFENPWVGVPILRKNCNPFPLFPFINTPSRHFSSIQALILLAFFQGTKSSLTKHKKYFLEASYGSCQASKLELF